MQPHPAHQIVFVRLSLQSENREGAFSFKWPVFHRNHGGGGSFFFNIRRTAKGDLICNKFFFLCLIL